MVFTVRPTYCFLELPFFVRIYAVYADEKGSIQTKGMKAYEIVGRKIFKGDRQKN